MLQQFAQQQHQRQLSVQEVIVKDVDISFGQMVVLLVKLAIASIPAAIILWIVSAASSSPYSAAWAR